MSLNASVTGIQIAHGNKYKAAGLEYFENTQTIVQASTRLIASNVAVIRKLLESQNESVIRKQAVSTTIGMQASILLRGRQIVHAAKPIQG